MKWAAVVLAVLWVHGLWAEDARAQPRSTALTAAERRAADSLNDRELRGHIRFLSHDLLEGRAPGTRGDRLAQEYISSQMELIGLEPAGPDGSWFQEFGLVGITGNPQTLQLKGTKGSAQLAFHTDFIAGSGHQRAQSKLEDAELVFVGYGIVAPEYGWDDYKGMDVKGKVLLFMNNDPESDPALFAGRARLWYGRWDYKYEVARRLGAAGAIIIHTRPSAGYGWNVVQTSWSGEQFELPAEPGEPRMEVKAWTTEEASRRLVALGGQELDALRAQAEKREFRPVPLGVRVSTSFANRITQVKTANVLGLLRGSDPKLAAETVVYSAHHDHLGTHAVAEGAGDVVHNGAVDNASGVAAMLAVARAMKGMPRPKRSVLFAAVAAEESGLLGSEFLAGRPPVHPGYLAANINIDGINFRGRTRDTTSIGFGKSDLDEIVVPLAAMQGRTVKPDQMPDRGFFYRSDQFNFAKIGVPSVYLGSGMDYIGRPPGWGKEQREKWEAERYHQPGDEYDPTWDLSGAMEDVRLYLLIGARVANAVRMPAWRKGDEFEHIRMRMLKERPVLGR